MTTILTRRMALAGLALFPGPRPGRGPLRPSRPWKDRADGTSWSGPGPFAAVGFLDKRNHWGGFSVDLARVVTGASRRARQADPVRAQGVHAGTRIPLLDSGTVNLIAGTMTITRARRDSLEFSAVYFVTGAQFLVKRGGPVRGVRTWRAAGSAPSRGPRTGALRERFPQAQRLVLPDQPAAFTALSQGKIDAYTNDGVQLATLWPRPPTRVTGTWSASSTRTSRTAWRCGRGTAFRNLVDCPHGSHRGGEYQKLYDRWFGPQGGSPTPCRSAPDLHPDQDRTRFSEAGCRPSRPGTARGAPRGVRARNECRGPSLLCRLPVPVVRPLDERVPRLACLGAFSRRSLSPRPPGSWPRPSAPSSAPPGPPPRSPS